MSEKSHNEVRAKLDAEMPPEGLTRDEALNVMTNAHALGRDLMHAVSMLEAAASVMRMPPAGLTAEQAEFFAAAITEGVARLQTYQLLKALQEKREADDRGAKAN